MNTASWSDIPGITLTWLTNVSLLVKNKSRVLDDDSVIRVGSVTICVRKASFDAFKSKVFFSLVGK